MECGFLPAEGRKRRKTFFPHAAGSMGSSAWGVSGREKFACSAWHGSQLCVRTCILLYIGVQTLDVLTL